MESKMTKTVRKYINTKKEIQANHNRQKHMDAYHRTSEIWEGKFNQTKRTSMHVQTESLYMRH
jgi:hypothetical protein